MQLPKSLEAVPLPGDPRLIGLMDGPIVLAGLNPTELTPVEQHKVGSAKESRPNYAINALTLCGDSAHPEDFLQADDEREWSYWRGDYRTVDQEANFRLIPLFEVRDEVYTVYFNVGK